MDASEVSRSLAARAEDVAQYLLPSGRKVGRDWVAGSVHGGKGDSLKVSLSGAKPGKWADFADGSDGSHGDLLDLWMAVRHIDFVEAKKEAEDYLGVASTTHSLKRPPAKEKKVYARPPTPTGISAASRHSEIGIWFAQERGIFDSTLKRWRIAEGEYKSVQRKDGTWGRWPGPWILFPYIRDGGMTNIKWRHLQKDPDSGKKILIQEKNAEPSLYGWHLVTRDDSYVVICEGEVDALTIDQYGHRALSVPQGGGSGHKQDWIDNDWDRLEQFRTIYLFLDRDDEGQEAARTIAQRLGYHRCMLVEWPAGVEGKDVNDLLVRHGWDKAQFEKLLDSAKSMEPAELRSAGEYTERVVEAFHPTTKRKAGYMLPWIGYENKFRFRPSEVTVLTGWNGDGKSLLLSMLELCAADQGARICKFSGEMTAEQTWVRAVKQLAVKERPDRERIEHCMSWMDGRIWLYDVKGSADRVKMLEAFEYAARRFGCDVFIIDSFMKCGIDEDDYNAQKAFMEVLIDFADRMGVHVVIVAHPRKPKSDAERPGKYDVAGSGNITNLAHNVWSAWRNRSKQEKIEKAQQAGDDASEIAKFNRIYDTRFTCHKQRNLTWEKSITLYFNEAFGLYKEDLHDEYPRCVTLDGRSQADIDQAELAFGA